MSDADPLYRAISTLVRGVKQLQRKAARQYRPVVACILRTRSRDICHIEHTLDRLLDPSVPMMARHLPSR